MSDTTNNQQTMGRMMPRWLHPLFPKGLMRPAPQEAGQATLRYRNIYILPNRNGFSFAVVLLVMLLGSMNYNLSLGYALTFLLGGMASASMLHSFRNLLGLQVDVGKTTPCFSGSDAQYELLFQHNKQRPRYSIGVSVDDRDAQFLDISTENNTTLTVARHARRRGQLPLGRVVLFTQYPLGLFRAWAVIDFDTPCPVWPWPARDADTLPMSENGDGLGQSIETHQGHDDFSGLRQYHPGDSLRHVAWKAVARGQEMMTKQFSGLGRASTWLDWYQLDGMMPEARLSLICRWILDAEQQGTEYGLRLPALEIPPNHGPAHKIHCLNALADFD